MRKKVFEIIEPTQKSNIYSSIYGFHVACQKILLESKRHPHLRNGFQKSYKQVPRHLIQVYHHCQGN